MKLEEIIRVDEFEELARSKLDVPSWSYYSGGAADEITLRDNIEAFQRRRLRPRVLRGSSEIDISTEILGVPMRRPIGIAPNSGQRLAHPDGEMATARAAEKAGVVMCLSTMSSCTMEEVAGAAGGPKFFQLYVHQDRKVAQWMVERAEKAGYRAIVLTADLPVPGYREKELRFPFEFDDSHGYGNYAGFLDTEGKEMMELLNQTIDANLTWDDVDWLRGLTDLPIAIKGVLTAEDAELCVEHGAAAVVVSNHGGRQLDRSLASVDALEEVVLAVDGRAEVYLDGGVRRGTDVIIALALGAKAVFVGRPYLYALAAFGEPGIARMFQLFSAELRNAMALLGVKNLSEITRSHVV